MNAPTEKERALANLRHLYQQMAGGQVKDSAQAKRIADGLLSPAIAKLEKAARRAPAAPVPQYEPVAYLWQHCETGRTRVVMPDMVITADANWIVVGPLYLAAAPRPPVAATVKLPEPFTTLVRKNSWAPNSYEAAPRSNHQEYGRQWADERIPVFTEQQVRQLLAAHGIGKDKA